jgi:hypothetical protein
MNVQLLIKLHQVFTDSTVPEYNCQFASLFISLILININLKNDKLTKLFSSVSDTILMTYLHRVIQLIDNKLDPIESREDYDELKEMVNSIHHEIKTNVHPEWTLKRIEDNFLFI